MIICHKCGKGFTEFVTLMDDDMMCKECREFAKEIDDRLEI
jgi:formylmethanofuran dehydrogenase subunit E